MDLKVHLVWIPKYRKRVLTGEVTPSGCITASGSASGMWKICWLSGASPSPTRLFGNGANGSVRSTPAGFDAGAVASTADKLIQAADVAMFQADGKAGIRLAGVAFREDVSA